VIATTGSRAQSKYSGNSVSKKEGETMAWQANPARYEDMQYRYCGRSGLQLPALSLGLWHSFGHIHALEGQRALLRKAFDCGITHFDLANNYGPPPGSAEENFGRLLKEDFASYRDELIVFLGASYFRALGAGQQYGLSARGLAVDTTGGQGEEFPRFDRFWLEKPAPDATRMTLYARLVGPRVTGAYRFDITPGRRPEGTTRVEVQARLFLRGRVATLGLAPLTSMFLSGENQPRPGDYRPELHDSNGLSNHDRQRRVDLAAAEQPETSGRQQLCDRKPAGLWPVTAWPPVLSFRRS